MKTQESGTYTMNGICVPMQREVRLLGLALRGHREKEHARAWEGCRLILDLSESRTAKRLHFWAIPSMVSCCGSPS